MARKFTFASNQSIGVPSLSSGTSYTFSVWFNSPLSQAYDTVILLGTSNTLKYYVKSNGTTALYDGGTGVWDGTGAATLPANTWHNLVLVVTATTATAYVDGTLDKSASATAGAINTTSTYAIDDVGAHFSNSIMADGALWNVALTTAEISGLARGERPSKIRPASLLFYHPLYGVDSQEPDLSGNKKTGTLVNFPTFNVGPPVNLSRPSFSSFLDPVSAAAQATATLTGAGSLSATAKVIAQAQATFAGTGALNVVATVPGAAVTATLAGSGALTASATVIARTSATLSGAGAISVTASLALPASATLVGAGALSAQAQHQVPATPAVLAGAGALTVDARVARAATAALSGSGSLAVTGQLIAFTTANLNGTGALIGAALPGAASATLSGAGALSVNATVARAASATLSGSGGISVSGRLIAQASALFAGVGNLNATAQGGIATATLVGSGSLTASARVIARAGATLAGSGVLNARGNIKALANSTLVGNGLLQATAAFPVTTSNAILQGAGGLTANAIVLSTVKKADIFCELSAYEGDCALSAYQGAKIQEEDDGDVFVRTAA